MRTAKQDTTLEQAEDVVLLSLLKEIEKELDRRDTTLDSPFQLCALTEAYHQIRNY